MIGLEYDINFDMFLSNTDVGDLKNRDLYGKILNESNQKVFPFSLGIRTNLAQSIYVDFDLECYKFFISPEVYVHILRNGSIDKETACDFRINIYNVEIAKSKKNSCYKTKRMIDNTEEINPYDYYWEHEL